MTATGPVLPAGVGVALVSLFGDDGDLDIAATVHHAVACVERGVSSVLVAGTTGEPWRLTGADRVELAGAVKAALPTVPVLVGTGDTDAGRAVALTAEVAGAGVADALVVLAPDGVAPGAFYRDIAAVAGSTPVLAYHLPALSAVGVPVDAVPSLPVAGIKDSSGDTDRLAHLLHDKQQVYVGSPNLLSTAGPCEATGALLALANTLPEMCIAAWDGDPDAQRRLFDAHVRSMPNFPGCLKPKGQR